MSTRVIVSGIDTLHLFTRAIASPDAVRILEEAKREATERRSNPLPSLDVAGHALAMQRHGARTAPLLLDSEHMAVRVNPASPENLPTVGVELRALYLWQRGAQVAAAEAQRVADALTVPPLAGEVRHPLSVTRADLAVDFQGWVPSPGHAASLVTRAATRSDHFVRRRFTGSMFGYGAVAARLYDKTAELKVSGKRWFREVWAQAPGYDPREPVWRLEFQLRREALRSIRVRSGDKASAHVTIDTWPDILRHACALWRHLASRWLAFRLPRTKHTRQRLAPEWSALVEGGFAGGPWGGADADLYRAAREEAGANTTAQLAGYLVAGLADHRFRLAADASLADAVPLLLARAERHAHRRGTTLEARAQAKVERWEAEMDSMAHGRGQAPHRALAGTTESTR